MGQIREGHHSMSLWHTDWYQINEYDDERWRGKWLIVAYMDDASRSVVGFRVFDEATTENEKYLYLIIIVSKNMVSRLRYSQQTMAASPMPILVRTKNKAHAHSNNIFLIERLKPYTWKDTHHILKPMAR